MIIKFNLLPKRVEVKPEVPKEPFKFYKLILGCVIFVISLVLTGVFAIEREYKSLLREKAEKEKKLKDLKDIVKKVEEMQKEMEDIKRRIETIVSLKRSHGEVLRRMHVILEGIGKNQVFFNSLNLSFNQASIEGLSTDMENIGEYFKTLESRREIVRQVNIKEVKKSGRLVEFQAEVVF